MCEQEEQFRISDLNPVIGDTDERDDIDELLGYTFVESDEKCFEDSHVVLYTDLGYSIRSTEDLQDTNICYVKTYEEYDLICTHKDDLTIDGYEEIKFPGLILS